MITKIIIFFLFIYASSQEARNHQQNDKDKNEEAFNPLTNNYDVLKDAGRRNDDETPADRIAKDLKNKDGLDVINVSANEDDDEDSDSDQFEWMAPSQGHREDETMDLYHDYDTDQSYDEYTRDELGLPADDDDVSDDQVNADGNDENNIDGMNDEENNKSSKDDDRADVFYDDEVNKNALVLHEDSKTSPAIFNDNEDNDEDEENEEDEDFDEIEDEEFDERFLSDSSLSNDARPWGRRRRSKRRRWIRPRIRIPIFRKPIRIKPIRIRLKPLFHRIGRIVKKIGGHVKRINLRKIGKFFGKLAQKTFNFFKCMFPKLFRSNNCLSQAFNSLKSCVKKNQECVLRLGGRTSNCLRISRFRTYRKQYGPITVTGHTSSALGLSLVSYINRRKTSITLYGHLAANAKIRMRLGRSSRKYYNRLELGDKKKIFDKMLTITIGGIPIPVRILIHIQPVAVVYLYTRTYGTTDVSITLNRDARISLDHARIEFSNGVPRFSKSTSNSFRHLRLVKHASINGGGTLNSYIQVGAEISISVGKLENIIFPNVEFALNGNYKGHHYQYPPGRGCANGQLSTTLRMRVKLQPNPKKITSVAQSFDRGCRKIARSLCKSPVGKIARCSFRKFNCERDIGKGCEGVSKVLKKIPNPIKKNPKARYFDIASIARGTWSFGNCRRG